MAEFLLELFSEEIPARMQVRAAQDLERIVGAHISSAGLAIASSEAHSTPRRLAVVFDGLATETPAVREERKGPRADAPAAAIEGFLRSTGLTLEDCERRATPKGDILYAVIARPGRPTAEVLVEAVEKALKDLPWPKSMRWGEAPFRWVRPLHHVLAVFDGQPIAGHASPEPHTRYAFTAMTVGHRFLSPGSIAVTGFADYKARLKEAHVLIDRAERRALIEAEVRRLAATEGLLLDHDEALIDEVVGLVEWPVVLLGSFDRSFLGVPPEVLVTSMKSHQRYFPLRDAAGTLAPRFAVVANTVTLDGGRTVASGNERVIRARLSDAEFFWTQDRQHPLESRLPELSRITFHARLGTVADKVDRMVTLSGMLADVLGADTAAAARAARLSKADLVTGMVGEFPELQGTMGRYYALGEGIDAAVADAIADHYRPLGPNDLCPRAPISVAVALADKIDTLTGFFAIGEPPTGSRDPYALRRAALGLIRLIGENGIRIALRGVIDRARAQYGSIAQDPDVTESLVQFIADRLQVAWREEGVRADVIRACFEDGRDDDLVRLRARVDTLQRFLGTADAANLLTAYRRAANIVSIERKTLSTAALDGPVDDSLLIEPQERELFSRLAGFRAPLAEAMAAEDFGGAMALLAQLRQPVDTFFDTVLVNAPEQALKINRLKLLGELVAAMDAIARFSVIEG